MSALVEVNTIYRKHTDKIDQILESKLHIFLKELLDFIYEKLVEYVAKNAPSIDYENTSVIFTSFHSIVELTEILVVHSKEFASYFHLIGGTKCLLAYFEHVKLVAYLTKSFTSADPFKHQRKLNYCHTLCCMLNTLLYLKAGRHQTFKEFRAIEILTKFATAMSLENCELILRSHLVLAEICTRKQIESLVNIDFTILILEKTIQMLAQARMHNAKCNVYEFDLFFGEEKRFSLCAFHAPNTFIVIILTCMEAFLVNDDVTYRAFGSIKDSLVVLLLHGDLMEKYLALSLLVNFCFDDILSETMRKSDANIIEFLSKMLKQLNLDESIRSMSFCLKTQLRNKNLINDHKQHQLALKPLDSARLATKTVLISYHEANDLICFRIRNELESLGYTVVLNERKLVGTLDFYENIVKSIEKSTYVLVCISSSYENQILCHFEAFYASKLKKIVFPIIVQDKYVPDYWIENFVKDFSETKLNLNTIKEDVLELSKQIELKNRLAHEASSNNSDTTSLGTPSVSNMSNHFKAESKTCQIL